MSDLEPTPAPSAPKPKKSRIGELVIVLVILGGIVALAFYQEPISYFISLHQWNRSGPGQTVTRFLSSGLKGDQKDTDACIDSSQIKSLSEGGKWVGYFVASSAGILDFRFTDLTPANGPRIQDTEYILAGKGAASVTAADSTGKPVKYRLEMQNNEWKITEINAGKPRRK